MPDRATHLVGRPVPSDGEHPCAEGGLVTLEPVDRAHDVDEGLADHVVGVRHPASPEVAVHCRGSLPVQLAPSPLRPHPGGGENGREGLTERDGLVPSGGSAWRGASPEVIGIPQWSVDLPAYGRPRHLTFIGAVTIGIPSFFLALAGSRSIRRATWRGRPRWGSRPSSGPSRDFPSPTDRSGTVPATSGIVSALPLPPSALRSGSPSPTRRPRSSGRPCTPRGTLRPSRPGRR